MLLSSRFLGMGTIDEVGFQFSKNRTTKLGCRMPAGGTAAAKVSEVGLLHSATGVQDDIQRWSLGWLDVAIDEEPLAIGRYVVAEKIAG